MSGSLELRGHDDVIWGLGFRVRGLGCRVHDDDDDRIQGVNPKPRMTSSNHTMMSFGVRGLGFGV